MADRPFLAFFTDENGRHRISNLKVDKPVNAGSTSKIVLWAMNITDNELLDVHITVDDKEAEVTPSRISRIARRELLKVTIIWKPNINRRTKLDTKLRSVATEVIR